MTNATEKHICTECESFRSIPFERVCSHPSNVKLNYTTGENEPVHSLKELNEEGTCKMFGQKKYFEPPDPQLFSSKEQDWGKRVIKHCNTQGNKITRIISHIDRTLRRDK